MQQIFDQVQIHRRSRYNRNKVHKSTNKLADECGEGDAIISIIMLNPFKRQLTTPDAPLRSMLIFSSQQPL